MFNTSNREFANAYFLSSMSLCSWMLFIFSLSVLLKIGKLGNSYLLILSLFNVIVSITLSIMGEKGHSLCLKKLTKEIQKDNKRDHMEVTVDIDSSYNEGVRDFIIGCFLPIISIYNFKDYPILTMILSYGLYFALYKFYLHSTEIFPNIRLIHDGYRLSECRIVTVKEELNDEIMCRIMNKRYYIFYKETDKLNDKRALILGSKSDVENSNICVLEE